MKMFYMKNQLSHLLPDTEATTLETSDRCSCDEKINKLLPIFSSYSYKIASGPTSGDFLRFNNRRKSVVLYLGLSRSHAKNVIKFKVLPINFAFKHAPITATFKGSFVKYGKGPKDIYKTIQKHLLGITSVLF